MAAAISCMRGVPASADITDWIAQIPYTIESAPQPMMAQRAVMKKTSFCWKPGRGPFRYPGTPDHRATQGSRPDPAESGADIAKKRAIMQRRK